MRHSFVHYAITATLVLSQLASAVFNGNYFRFPANLDYRPTVNIGDSVNISWTASFDKINLTLFCNDQAAGPDRKIVNLPNNTNLPSTSWSVFKVDSTWIDPCHFALVNASSPDGGFNSGGLLIQQSSTAQAATTWGAPSFPICTPTAATGSPTASASITPTTCLSATAASNSSAAGELGFGAGIGAGVGIAVGVGAVSALLFWVLTRRKGTGNGNQPISSTHSMVYPTDHGKFESGQRRVQSGHYEMHTGRDPYELATNDRNMAR